MNIFDKLSAFRFTERASGNEVPGFGSSNIDIMSGRALPSPSYYHQQAHKGASSNYSDLSRNLSRLFIHNQPYTKVSDLIIAILSYCIV